MTSKLKKIIILILAVALMFVVYTLTTKPKTEVDPLITGNFRNDTQLLGAQISQALLRIEQITLDKSIFQDAIYTSLQDRSNTIESEPKGRPNPFAPIGDTSSVSIQRSLVENQTTQSEPEQSAPAPVNNPQQ